MTEARRRGRAIRGSRPPAPVPLLVDCDNTFGISGSEIDDGLTLLLLLAHTHAVAGEPLINLVGVTATFGNGPEDAVFNQTRDLLGRAGRSDIPVVHGARWPGETDTEAARFICRSAAAHNGRLVILSIGPVTNLAAALALDGSVADRIAHVYLMGGYLRRLRFPRREVRELNISCDPHSAATVLHSRSVLTLINAQLCLQARYGLRHLLLDRILNPRLGRVIAEWLATFSMHTGALGFYLWDLVPAVAMLEPERLRHRRVLVTSSAEDLAAGMVRYGDAGSLPSRAPAVVDMPTRIYRSRRFATDCARIWRRAGVCASRRLLK